MHKQLLEASRRAGMAEVATNVLHNAGNALNSVTVSANLIAIGLKQLHVVLLAKVADLIQEHAADLASFFASDERGRELPAYLKRLARYFADEQARLLAEAQNLSSNIDHICNIIGMQQAHASSTDMSETLQPAELIEEAIRGLCESQLPGNSFHIVRQIGDTRPIRGDRHKVLQILSALLQNAAQACGGKAVDEPKIVVRLAETGERIRIEVAYNGIGIAPDDLNNIFSQRFSAGNGEHGLVLHNAAVASRQVGGSLTARSNDINQGATFTFELSIDRQPGDDPGAQRSDVHWK